MNTELPTREQMQQLLTPALRCISQSRLRSEVSRAADHFLRIVLIAAMLILATRFLHADSVRRKLLLLASAGVCLGGLVAVVGRGLRLRKDHIAWAEAAERLDAACGQNNLVATAWHLLSRGVTSPFATAAVEQGWLCLKNEAARNPLLSPVSYGFIRKLSLAAAVLLLAGLSRWISLPALEMSDRTMPLAARSLSPVTAPAGQAATASRPPSADPTGADDCERSSTASPAGSCRHDPASRPHRPPPVPPSAGSSSKSAPP